MEIDELQAAVAQAVAVAAEYGPLPGLNDWNEVIEPINWANCRSLESSLMLGQIPTERGFWPKKSRS